MDLSTITILQHFASDRAPYITSGLVIIEDAETGVGNTSCRRSMVHSPTELATSLHSRGDLWRLCEEYPASIRRTRRTGLLSTRGAARWCSSAATSTRAPHRRPPILHGLGFGRSSPVSAFRCHSLCHSREQYRLAWVDLGER
ncbi:UbiD family decarboxylase domain-containing protein [Saccharopolyspora sp. ASAGF58]|uniref:UbiD family decarboxylase domain-containing protein n=1 Tax=Saccharopolyspora sp. ASAGF58 TaxID=2719023 RepID=UPI001B3045F1